MCSIAVRAQYIGNAEYFWDTDPGAGNGIALTAADGNLDSVLEDVVLSTASVPSNGQHTLGVRVRDGNNVWGPVFSTIINVLPNVSSVREIKVTMGEYFWDTDPGQGSGTAMVAFDGAFDAAVETAYQSGIAVPGSLGVHTFNVRVQGADNNWGPVFKTIINVDPSIVAQRVINVSAGEYFWDTDPGAGSGSVMIAFDGAFDDAVETAYQTGIAVPGVLGVHTFNVRVMGADNNWGPVFKTVINVDPSITAQRQIQVTAAEYFWDTDPGAGSAIAMIAFDGAFDDAIETAYQSGIAVPGTVGVHTFNVRARGADNNWGPVFSTIINVDPSITAQRQIMVTAGEYFFDTDPGPGSATAMIAFDGSFDNVMETLAGGAIPIPVTAGIHVLYMRARGADNNWGPKFGVVVNMDTSITNVGIAEVATALDVVVSPNPFSEQFTVDVKTGSGEVIDIFLTDIRGSLIKSMRTSSAKTVLNCSELASGVYIVGIKQGSSGIAFRKLVKE